MNASTTTPQHTEHLQDTVLEWLVRRQDPQWSSRDEAAFQTWLQENALHRQLYARSEARWRELDHMPADLQAKLQQSLARDQYKASQHAQPSFSTPTRRKFLAWPVWSAMTTAAIGGVGYMAWQAMDSGPTSVQAFRTERGQIETVTLDEGSSLRLDTATQLEVRLYRRQREVLLQEGQAMFEVAQDGRPFHVIAGNTRVTVVGTRFSVRYTPSIADTGVQVAVEEGKVRVAALQKGEAQAHHYDAAAGTLLVAGQQVYAQNDGTLLPLMQVPADGVAPWRDGLVSFLDVPLSQAIAELERYAATGLVVHDPHVASLRLTGTFNPLSKEALHKALPRVLPVRLQARAGKTEIVALRK